MPRRVKRFARRCLAVMIGLYLGWMAAGVAFNQLPQAAADTPRFAAADPHAPDANADSARADGGHDHGAADHAVEQLTPGQGQADWFCTALIGAAILFALAIAVGLTFGENPPPPAPSHDDHGHDEHGHDSHGDGHGQGGAGHATGQGSHGH